MCYAYDLNGNRLQKVGSKHQSYYTYDSLNRLSSAKYNIQSKSLEESFTYDKVGNRLAKITNEGIEKYKYNVKNQLLEIHTDSGITKFNYDKQGNLKQEQHLEDITSYGYNSFNQTVKAVTKEGNTLVNRYDAEGLRFEIEENERLTRFVFHKENILVETDKDYAPIFRFTRGYEIVAADINDGDLESNRYYYTQDEQGSTIYITDKEQQVKNEYYYDAFGCVLDSREDVHNRITYTGQQYDPITQQYYLRSRNYNPVIARFTQEDTYRGDGLGLYSYCHSNPVIYYDPSGYMGCGKKKHAGAGGNKGTTEADIIANRVSGFDLTPKEKPYNILSSKKMSQIKAKINDRTITKEEWKRYDWNKRFKNRRDTGVDAFWEQERQRILNGDKTTRNWVTDQIEDILNGNTPKYNGKTITGHHSYGASKYPHLADKGEVIYPATFNEHLNKWHGRNYRNSNPGSPINPLYPDDF